MTTTSAALEAVTNDFTDHCWCAPIFLLSFFFKKIFKIFSWNDKNQVTFSRVFGAQWIQTKWTKWKKMKEKSRERKIDEDLNEWDNSNVDQVRAKKVETNTNFWASFPILRLQYRCSVESIHSFLNWNRIRTFSWNVYFVFPSLFDWAGRHDGILNVAVSGWPAHRPLSMSMRIARHAFFPANTSLLFTTSTNYFHLECKSIAQHTILSRSLHACLLLGDWFFFSFLSVYNLVDFRCIFFSFTFIFHSFCFPSDLTLISFWLLHCLIFIWFVG